MEKGNAGTNLPKSSKSDFPSEGGQKNKNSSLKNRKKNVSFWGQLRISSNYSLRQGRCFCNAPLNFQNIKTRGKHAQKKCKNVKTRVFKNIARNVCFHKTKAFRSSFCQKYTKSIVFYGCFARVCFPNDPFFTCLRGGKALV